MSKYVDRFIKQHKEYFRRNKKVIESNDWNDDTQTEDNVEELFDRIKLLSKTDDKESQKEISQLKKEIFSIKSNRAKNKKALFMQENELTDSIVGRLSAFIKETEKNGDRNLKRVQTFVEETVDIINIHIEKCDKYLDYKLDDLTEEVDEEEVELKSEEIRFQNDVFTKKIKIQDTLDILNISNSIENVKIEFYKNQKASLPMMSVLPAFSRDIKEMTDKLKLPKKPIDLTFHIHRKPKDIPVWDEKKHYWEQSQEVLDYWYSEWLKITNGFTVDGYFFHPWLYYHLNFYKTPIPAKEGGDVVRNPDLRDNEWFVAEQLKAIALEDGYYTKEGILIYGSRRIAKSSMMSSICDWRALIVANISTSITSGSDGDLAELSHKIKVSMKFSEPAFKLPIQKQEWSGGHVELGLKADAQTLLEHSRHTIKNLAGGGQGSTQKTAGGAPSIYLIEEIGKFSWKKSYLAALPSFQSDFGLKTIIIAVGTGGEASLSSDAMEALSNPKKLKFREMDWDLFESKIPKECITWNRRKFATFIPGQMGYRDGFKRIKQGFGDFLGIKSKYLNSIDMYATDWKNNTDIILAAREEAKGDNLLLQQEAVQYPIDPEECFLSAEKNPFNYEQARKQKEYLLESGKWDRRRKVLIDENGKIKPMISTEKLAEYPHKGGIVDAPILMFEDLPERTPVDNLYVASFDDVKQDDSDTDSLICFQIWKMDTFGDEWGDRLVLSWTCRPESRKDMYSKWLLLQRAYNAKAFPENEDMGYKTFLEGKHLDEQWLIQGLDFTSSMNLPNNNKRKYGWTPRQSKTVLFGLFKEYCNEIITEEDENGNSTTMFGVQKINDIGLLEEIINFKKDGNFDRISAALGAYGWMHYLKVNWILPKIKKETNKDSSKKQIKNIRSFYSTTKQKSLYKK